MVVLLMLAVLVIQLVNSGGDDSAVGAGSDAAGADSAVGWWRCHASGDVGGCQQW